MSGTKPVPLARVTIGAGATLRPNTLYVGKGSNGGDSGAGTTGTFNQTGGLVAQANAANDWRIGGGNAPTTANTPGAGATGVYNLSGGTLDTGSSNFQVGAYGVGTLNQTGGVVNSNSYTDAGRYVGGLGVINVSGGGVFNETAGGGTTQSTAAHAGYFGWRSGLQAHHR